MSGGPIYRGRQWAWDSSMTDQDTAAHPLEAEIAAYHRMRPELEEHHKGKFVVIKGAELQGTFDTLDHAANFAREKLGRGPYLIRQVAVDYGPLPASVLYRVIAPA